MSNKIKNAFTTTALKSMEHESSEHHGTPNHDHYPQKGNSFSLDVRALRRIVESISVIIRPIPKFPANLIA
jgi:hypothetical protein